MKLKYSTKPDDLEKINSPEELKKIVRTHEKAARRLKWQRKALLYILGLILATAAYFGAVWFCSNALASFFIHDIPAITVKRVQAAEVKPVKQAKTYTIPQIVDAVHILESSGGVKDGCIAKGKINGFGFAQTGDGKTWDCFKNYKEVRTRVEQWYTEKLKTMTLAQALCYYNLGKPKGVLLNDCPYYQNFLKVVES